MKLKDLKNKLKKGIIPAVLVTTLTIPLAISPIISEATSKIKRTYTILDGTKTKCLPNYTQSDDITYTYNSANKKIAKVNKKGVVTGVNEGSTIIKVTKKQTGKPSSYAYYQINVTSLEIEGEDKLAVGKTSKYKTNITNDVEWESSNESIITVNNGTVTAVGAGTATLIANYGDAIAIKTITVTSDGTSDSTSPLAFVKTTETININETFNLTVNQANAVWSSSDNSVAYVDKTTGLLIGIKEGKAVITATVNDKSISTTVTVKSVSDNNNIKIDTPLTGTSTNYTLKVGETATCYSNLSGTNWVSTNTNVVTIDKTTGVLKAIGTGTANIVGTNGTQTVLIKITVVANNSSNNNSNSSSNNNNNNNSNNNNSNNDSSSTLAITNKIDSLKLGTYNYLTSNKSNTTWISSDPSVINVDSKSGVIYGAKEGSATIFAINGIETVSIKIQVTTNGTSKSLSITSQITEMEVGKTATFTSNQTDTKWTSSNTSILDIDNKTGKATAKATGVVFIYAIYNDEITYTVVDVVSGKYNYTQMKSLAEIEENIDNISIPTTGNLEEVKLALESIENAINTLVKTGVSINDIKNYSLYESRIKQYENALKEADFEENRAKIIENIETLITKFSSDEEIDITTPAEAETKYKEYLEIKNTYDKAVKDYSIKSTSIGNYSTYKYKSKEFVTKLINVLNNEPTGTSTIEVRETLVNYIDTIIKDFSLTAIKIDNYSDYANALEKLKQDKLISTTSSAIS